MSQGVKLSILTPVFFKNTFVGTHNICFRKEMKYINYISYNSVHLAGRQPTFFVLCLGSYLTLVLYSSMELFLSAPVEDTRLKCSHPAALATSADWMT